MTSSSCSMLAWPRQPVAICRGDVTDRKLDGRRFGQTSIWIPWSRMTCTSFWKPYPRSLQSCPDGCPDVRRLTSRATVTVVPSRGVCARGPMRTHGSRLMHAMAYQAAPRGRRGLPYGATRNEWHDESHKLNRSSHICKTGRAACACSTEVGGPRTELVLTVEASASLWNVSPPRDSEVCSHPRQLGLGEWTLRSNKDPNL